MTITAKSCAKFLREHNEWRRGGEGPMLEPKDIGENIEFAIEALEFLDCFIDQITDVAAAFDIATLEQESRQMRARMERLEKELETERALSFRNQVAELEKQRDELLAALTECMTDVDDYERRAGKQLAGEWPARARAAIANAKGQK